MSGGDRGITNPEQALWQEVLYLAVQEALYGPKNVLRVHHARMWREARDYLTTPSRDLAMVCALAGVDMEAVIDRMRFKLDVVSGQTI